MAVFSPQDSLSSLHSSAPQPSDIVSHSVFLTLFDFIFILAICTICMYHVSWDDEWEKRSEMAKRQKAKGKMEFAEEVSSDGNEGRSNAASTKNDSNLNSKLWIHAWPHFT